MIYSQHHEQNHILENTPEHGRFLDIGAYHPKIFSNTRALYERGWSGVMVEPSPLPFESLLREYGNDERITLVCAAVTSGVEQMVKIYATADALSTTDERWYAEISGRVGYAGGFYGSFLIPTLNVLELAQLGPFDFVSIDTEGTSEQIADQVSYILRPACICSETTGADLDGYKVVYENGTNRVYVKH